MLEDELVAALLASAKADLDAAVAAGQITAAQAAVGIAAEKAELEQFVTTSKFDQPPAGGKTDEALEALRLADDKRSLAIVMNNRAYIALGRGDCERAVALCEQSSRLGSEIGNEEVMAQALLNLGFASLGLDRLAEASAALVRGLQLAAELGFRDWVGYALEGLAALSAANGRMDRALRLVASAAALRDETGTQLDPAEQKVHDDTLDAVHKSFSSEEIEAAFRDRTSQTLAEAVEYALAADSDRAPSPQRSRRKLRARSSHPRSRDRGLAHSGRKIDQGWSNATT